MQSMATLEGDSVSFLAWLKEECPDILLAFTTELIKLISRSPNDPYSKENVNEEYLSDEWAHHEARKMWMKGRVNLSEYLMKPKGTEDLLKPQELAAFEKKNRSLEKVS